MRLSRNSSRHLSKIESIQTEQTNLWSPIKERKLQTWKTTRKKIKVSSAGQIVELQERQKPVCTHDGDMKSRPEIDIQEAVGTYEFTVVLISMFATDGEMLH